MHAAVMIAKVMGPLLIILGLWFLFCQEFLTKMRVTAEKAPGPLYVAGVINLILGLIIITGFNVWHWNIFLSVTLLGWFLTLRGIYMLFMPGKFFGTKPPGGLILKIYGIVPLVWGCILLWAAYKK